MNGTTNDRSGNFRYVSGKLIATILVIALLALGVIGLVLPILPGLLLLAIAGFIAARHFPWVDARLRRHRAIGKHMHTADRFQRLSFGEKVRVAGWFCVKLAADGLAIAAAAVARLAASIKSA